MNKRELIEFLQPFDDEIEIDFNPVFTIENGNGSIKNSNIKIHKEKTLDDWEEKERFIKKFGGIIEASTLDEIWDRAEILSSAVRKNWKRPNEHYLIAFEKAKNYCRNNDVLQSIYMKITPYGD